jgi:hypothetical protein
MNSTLATVVSKFKPVTFYIVTPLVTGYLATASGQSLAVRKFLMADSELGERLRQV